MFWPSLSTSCNTLSKGQHVACFISISTKIGTIQGRLAWPRASMVWKFEIRETLYFKKKLQHETFPPKRYSNYNSNCIIFFFFTPSDLRFVTGNKYIPQKKQSHKRCQARFAFTILYAKSLQSSSTPCDPIDGSPPGSAVPGIFQARTLEWVATAFSNAWKWKGKVKSLSRVRLFETPRTAAYQAPLSTGVSRQEYWSGVPLPSPTILCKH